MRVNGLKGRILLLISSIIIALFSSSVYAAEEDTNSIQETKTNSLRLNFKQISLDISSTNVKNAAQYINSPITPLSTNDELAIKGTFDTILEYERKNFQWNNRLYMVYGQTTITELDGTKTKSESADQILYTTDLSAKLWKLKNADIGPFGSLGYQTEFTENGNSPRNSLLRSNFGIKLFNGKIFYDLYLANVFELDLTYARAISKYGLEFGLDARYNIAKNVAIRADGYYRQYLAFSSYNPNDLKYDISFGAYLDVKIIGVLNISPFIKIRQAHSRGAKNYASNINMGISLLYSDLFNLF